MRERPGPQPDAAPACAAPDFAPRRPRLALPAGACDCHAHVLGPAARYLFVARRLRFRWHRRMAGRADHA